MTYGPDSIWPNQIWVVGCGNMGGAILQAWLENGAPAENVTVVDPNPSRLPRDMTAQPEFPQDVSSDLVLLSVKPQTLPDITAKIGSVLGVNSTIVSVLAGVEVETLRQAFPSAGPIIRLVPNMAAAVGKSPMILFGTDVKRELREQMNAMFRPLGEPEWLDDEDLLHLATALSGSGPAFLFRFIDALAQAANDLGLEKDQADRLALAMVEGASLLAAQSDDDPHELAERVASPGGTTRKGLDVIDADGRMNALIFDVLKAATDRSREMADEAKAS